MFWRFGIGGRQPPRRRDQLVERGVDAPRPRMDERRERVRVRALELRELAVLQDLPRERVPEGQLLQDVHVGGVAGLGALERRQLQLLEEHDGELLGRVRVDRLAGELVDLPQERVELRVELLRQPARGAPGRPGSRAAPCRRGWGPAAPRASRRGDASPCSPSSGRLGLGEPPHALGPRARSTRRAAPGRCRPPARRPGASRARRAPRGRPPRPSAGRAGTRSARSSGDTPPPPCRRRAPRPGRPRAARPGDEAPSCRAPRAPRRREAPAGPRGRPRRRPGAYAATPWRVRSGALPPRTGSTARRPPRAREELAPPRRVDHRHGLGRQDHGLRRDLASAARRTRARSRARAAAPTRARGPGSAPGRTRWGASPRAPPADARGRPGRGGARASHAASGR